MVTTIARSSSTLMDLFFETRQYASILDADCDSISTHAVAHQQSRGERLKALASFANANNPLVMKTPFEDVDSIAGGIWRPDDGNDDALLLLRFERGTVDLPLHSHEASDRMIVVLAGRGEFRFIDTQSVSSASRRVSRIVVQQNDLLVFPRGTIHTFVTGDRPLLLLSYHRPFIPLDDPRQFTVWDGNVPDQSEFTWNTRVNDCGIMTKV